MIKVPCILPRIRLIAIADRNMPVMIHTRSISLGSPHSRHICSRHRCISYSNTDSTCTVSSECPYPQRYGRHIVGDDHDLNYHTYMPSQAEIAIMMIQKYTDRIQIYMPLMLGFI